MTNQQKAQAATEIAFSALIGQAKDVGLKLQPVMGLMYLPSDGLTRQFQVACRAILQALMTEQTNEI